MAGPYEVVTGVVVSSNEWGIKIDGQDSYFNYSKFHRTKGRNGPPVAKGEDWCMSENYKCAKFRGFPDLNDEVSVSVDAKNYIHDIEVEAPGRTNGHTPARTERTERAPAATSSGKRDWVPNMTPEDKLRVTKLSCLETATRILVMDHREETPVEEQAMALADRLAMWAIAPYGIPNLPDPSAPAPEQRPQASAPTQVRAPEEGEIDFDELFGNTVDIPEPDLKMDEFVTGYYANGHDKNDLMALVGLDPEEKMSPGAVERWKTATGKTYRELLEGLR